jgi:hypothetical protein
MSVLALKPLSMEGASPEAVAGNGVNWARGDQGIDAWALCDKVLNI